MVSPSLSRTYKTQTHTLSFCSCPHLREPPHAEQAVHGAGALVPVHRAQLGPAQRQVAVRVVAVLVDGDMEGAVHGAQLQQEGRGVQVFRRLRLVVGH